MTAKLRGVSTARNKSTEIIDDPSGGPRTARQVFYINIPRETQVDDLLIFYGVAFANTGVEIAISEVQADGWTVLEYVSSNYGENSHLKYLIAARYYKSTDPNIFKFRDVPKKSWPRTLEITGTILAYTDVRVGPSVTDAIQARVQSSDVSLTAPTVHTVTDNTLVLRLYGVGSKKLFKDVKIPLDHSEIINMQLKGDARGLLVLSKAYGPPDFSGTATVYLKSGSVTYPTIKYSLVLRSADPPSYSSCVAETTQTASPVYIASMVSRMRPQAYFLDLSHQFVKSLEFNVVATAASSVAIQPKWAFAQDSYISSSKPDTRYGSDDVLKLGADGTGGEYRVLVEMPLRSISPGSNVTGATLTFNVVTHPGTSFTGMCERVHRYDWDQVASTWDEFVQGSPWTTPGGDVSDTPSGFTFTVPTSGDLVLSGSSLVNLVQDALDNRGSRLVLRLRLQSGSEMVSLISGQNLNHDAAPKLDVIYSDQGLGFPHTGMKRAVGSWMSSINSGSLVNYMAVGIGTGDLVSNWRNRHRLSSEIYRKPVIGMTFDGINRFGDIWAYFGPGEGIGNITELALFTGDNVALLDNCDGVTGWTAGGWSVEGDGNIVAEGQASIAAVAFGATDSIISKQISVKLGAYTKQDFLVLWLRPDRAGITSLSVRLTDENGTWTWAGLENNLTPGSWQNIRLQFSDAITTSTATGPGTISLIEIIPVADRPVVLNIDHIRVIPADEDILAWWRPDVIVLPKSKDQGMKMRLRLQSMRSTN